jgi:hypothetical protein
VAAVSHPSISPEEYDGLMLDAGRRAPLERLAGEVIVVAPIDGHASRITLALTRRWQDWQRAGSARGLLRQARHLRSGPVQEYRRVDPDGEGVPVGAQAGSSPIDEA